MPSTYSVSLRVELQADGENSATWGQKANNDFNLFEASIAGRVVAPVGGAVDVTLTAINGAADQSRNARIELTGVLTGNINVIVPTVTKNWNFFNNTTGAFSLTVKPAAGTGIVVAQGTKRFLSCDGTNVVDDLSTYPIITLPLPIANGGSGATSAALARAAYGSTAVGDAVFIAATAAAARTAIGSPAVGVLIGVQVFTTPGTSIYTPTPGTNRVEVECVGGGAGAGACAPTGAAQLAVGSSAGGGGYARELILSGFSGVTITVGAKGIGGAAGANDGTDGGTSSFGALLSATGGVKGKGAVAQAAPSGLGPGAGGLGSGGDINASGQPGQIAINGVTTAVFNGAGGGSIWGGGAMPFGTANGSAGANAPNGFGGGGAGGINTASQATGKAGGDGTPGIVVVREYA